MFTKMKIALALCATLAGGVAMADGFRGGGAGGRGRSCRSSTPTRTASSTPAEKAAMKPAWEAKRAERKAEMLAKFDTNKDGTHRREREGGDEAGVRGEARGARGRGVQEARRRRRRPALADRVPGRLAARPGHAPPRARSLPSSACAPRASRSPSVCRMLAAMATRRVPPLAVAFVADRGGPGRGAVGHPHDDERRVRRRARTVRPSRSSSRYGRTCRNSVGRPMPRRSMRCSRITPDEGLRYIARHRRPRPRARGGGHGGRHRGCAAASRCTSAGASASSCARRCGGRGRPGPRPWSLVLEIDPIEANELLSSATCVARRRRDRRDQLLGVAIVLVRREARRNAEERERERERRLAHLGEMSAVLAHEIKNPLASLKGNAQLLARMLPPGEKSRAKAERVVDEAVRLEPLTNDLLEFVAPASSAHPDRSRRRSCARPPQRARRDRGRGGGAPRRGRSTRPRIRAGRRQPGRQRGRRGRPGEGRGSPPRAASSSSRSPITGRACRRRTATNLRAVLHRQDAGHRPGPRHRPRAWSSSTAGRSRSTIVPERRSACSASRFRRLNGTHPGRRRRSWPSRVHLRCARARRARRSSPRPTARKPRSSSTSAASIW